MYGCIHRCLISYPEVNDRPDKKVLIECPCNDKNDGSSQFLNHGSSQFFDFKGKRNRNNKWK